MRVVRRTAELRRVLETLPVHGAGVSFVPTMGALHEGHLALVRQAAGLGRPLVVSIFVNPSQFGPGEDLDRYPRDLDGDLRACEREGVDVAFTPDVATVYPPEEEIAVPPLPAVATGPGLEDAHRPGHFAGVCQVVARLLDLVRPAVAVFGEKDYQQLLVVRAMVEAAPPGRWPGLRIAAGPTVREPDGLAMSSRNALLRPQDRQAALGLSRALAAAAEATDVGAAEAGAAEAGAAEAGAAEAAMHRTLADHGLQVDYAVVRDARTLEPIPTLDRPARALIAARLGAVRLIDNAALPQRP